ncbi:DNA topoisomerase VI subunit B [Methanonatronarchaeum thermophilum]|uniref:Type 2 DNA topoisomerase 6 subunit B n=1 Tax=Methanonatronarchaeum thermophilum TaxID=1927129 RepID=A0A1Y3GCV6_9EURY|nr:DNA topoisomerase VI subunit B [Methanonatronarchaeum thermophilum]OUJ19278.1 DNA topoisomerase VI subunit B [Methanonatronarchaeum thermophilum]
MEDPIAESLAESQKEISVAEFFERNRQMLGFDSSARSLITCVKEGVDNSLDACEEAGYLPDLYIEITEKNDEYKVVIEDNGPGVIKKQIPKIFGKLLYGSRFHKFVQSRGQQGIGISAAVLYGQLTTGKSARIISKISPDDPAHLYEININTDTNEPEITRDEVVDWTRPHGTRIEIHLTGMYVKGRRQSIYNYLKTTGIANPHARITFVEPGEKRTVFERAVNELPPKPKEIKPHPAGIELGTLLKMMRKTESRQLNAFLKNEFTRVGKTTAQEICETANLKPQAEIKKMGRKEAKKLINAFKQVNLISPPTDCLSPMGRDRIEKGLSKEYPEAEYITATTRSASVYSGNPFIVETGIAYGIQKPEEEKIDLLRLANRVPLLYQRGGCVTTKAIKDIDWRRYELNQSGGTGIPKGPAVIMIHVASTNVPFTSESKDAIANVEQIRNEVERAVRETARNLKKYLKRQKRISQRKSKRNVIQKIIPDMAQKLQKITGKQTKNTEQVIAKINNNFLVTTNITKNQNHHTATINLENHDRTKKEIQINLPLTDQLIEAKPKPKKQISEDHITLQWNRQLSSGEKDKLKLKIKTPKNQKPNIKPQITGIPKEILTITQTGENQNDQ